MSCRKKLASFVGDPDGNEVRDGGAANQGLPGSIAPTIIPDGGEPGVCRAFSFGK